MFNIDIEWMKILTNVVVGVGTLLLAYFSYRNIKFIKVQSKSIYNQSNYLRVQQAPFLRVENWEVNKNKISLKLTNIGNGIANEIGIMAIFHIADLRPEEPPVGKERRELNKKSNEAEEELKKERVQDGKIWVKPYLMRIILYEKKERIEILGRRLPVRRNLKVVPSEYITYLKEAETSTSSLEPGSSDIFACDPLMSVRTIKNFGQVIPEREERFSFEEVLELCKKINVRYISIKMDLVYKDLAGNIQTPEEIINCIVIVNSHNNIEMAIDENIQTSFYELRQRDLEKKIGGKPGFLYWDKLYPDDPFEE